MWSLTVWANARAEDAWCSRKRTRAAINLLLEVSNPALMASRSRRRCGGCHPLTSARKFFRRLDGEKLDPVAARETLSEENVAVSVLKVDPGGSYAVGIGLIKEVHCRESALSFSKALRCGN